jgi:hypothetical protein
VGRTVLPDGAELIEMQERDPKLSATKIAKQFGVTPQAVSDRIKRYKAKADSEPSLTPWKVDKKHKGCQFDRGANAYAKWNAKGELTPREETEAEWLRELCSRLGLVLAYDQETGYWCRGRKKTDVDILVVK